MGSLAIEARSCAPRAVAACPCAPERAVHQEATAERSDESVLHAGARLLRLLSVRIESESFGSLRLYTEGMSRKSRAGRGCRLPGNRLILQPNRGVRSRRRY